MNLEIAQPQARLEAKSLPTIEKAHPVETNAPFANQLNFQTKSTILPAKTQLPRCRKCRNLVRFLHLIARQDHPAAPVSVVQLCGNCANNISPTSFDEALPRECANGCGKNVSDANAAVCEECLMGDLPYRPQPKLVGNPNDRFCPMGVED